jgi:hypothetical protein
LFREANRNCNKSYIKMMFTIRSERIKKINLNFFEEVNSNNNYLFKYPENYDYNIYIYVKKYY